MVGSSEGRTGTEGGRACNCQALHMLAWSAPNRLDGASFQLHSRCTPRSVYPLSRVHVPLLMAQMDLYRLTLHHALIGLASSTFARNAVTT